MKDGSDGGDPASHIVEGIVDSEQVRVLSDFCVSIQHQSAESQMFLLEALTPILFEKANLLGVERCVLGPGAAIEFPVPEGEKGVDPTS